MLHRTVLVVGAHPDDEVLGCGGTMARLAGEGTAVHVLLMADGESARGEGTAMSAEIAARRGAAEAAASTLGCASIKMHSLPDNRLDTVPLLDVVKLIEERIESVQPDAVFAHHADDVNVDHRIVHEAVLAACRPQPGHCVEALYFYEVLSSTHWRPPGSGHFFAPNVFFDVSDHMPSKRRALEAYASEMRPFPHARSYEAAETLARWHGSTVGVPAAEAFMLGRAIVRAMRNIQ